MTMRRVMKALAVQLILIYARLQWMTRNGGMRHT
eukprot:CAMPEP_0174718638 /NCGR_PEP_ID=MMETSP1094-20130205/29547_1 /TAXON_ID=156173 /ORGANISM="Chrysochromulina brevifilum, Strain UTEX LB 985" /LENGTH=33 /DNA_ID= /DNA_START= /DNA_END= /DNA_ORIENTATION=